MEKEEFLKRVVLNPFIRNFILSRDVRRFIACQFALESDFGKSDLATKYFNLGGMKIPHRRVSYRCGEVGRYCVYNTTNDFFLDYLSWIFYNRPYQNNLESLDSFKLFLRDSAYCPEEGYINRIESIYNQYFLTSKN